LIAPEPLQEIKHHKKAFEVFLGELYRTLDEEEGLMSQSMKKLRNHGV
jgi:hypothetical protein